MTDYSITLIQQHHYDKGARAFADGRDIDAHGMRPGTIAIAHWQRGWIDARRAAAAKALVKPMLQPMAAGVPP